MRAWQVTVGLTCLWLTACSPKDELTAHFQTYLTRVAYVLEVPAPKLMPAVPFSTFPAQRELMLTTPRISTGLLDALRLNQCDLLGLVAEHNGPAGKSLSAAGQLAYHLQFQQGLTLCLSHTEEVELKTWLTELIDAKQPLLADYFWQLMIAEPEVRAALTPRQPSLSLTAQGGYQATYQALSLLARLQRQTELQPTPLTPEQAKRDIAKLNQALAGLYKNPYLGQLLYSLASGADYLQQSADFLAQLADFDCQGANAVKAERLRNALAHYYMKDLQPYFARLDRQFVALAPLLEATLTPPPAATAAVSQAIQDYRAQGAMGLNSDLYVSYRQLTLQHATLWQEFLARCQLSPSGN